MSDEVVHAVETKISIAHGQTARQDVDITRPDTTDPATRAFIGGLLPLTRIPVALILICSSQWQRVIVFHIINYFQTIHRRGAMLVDTVEGILPVHWAVLRGEPVNIARRLDNFRVRHLKQHGV